MIRFLLKSILVFWLLLFGIVKIMDFFDDFITSIGGCREFNETNLREDITHHRSWNTTDNLDHCMSYEIDRTDFESSHQIRSNIKEPTWQISFNEYWGKVYQQLIRDDDEYLAGLYDSLDQIRIIKNLNRNEFAHTIISFVQDIPYTLIATDCEVESTGGPCYEGGDWGILGPAEFMYTLKGDCDTRTVLLFLVLRQFGYDPLVMISREYEHSMLALDIQAAGHSITHRNTKHYFWETTGTGWQPGMLPPDMQNLDYWHIALYHEL